MINTKTYHLSKQKNVILFAKLFFSHKRESAIKHQRTLTRTGFIQRYTRPQRLIQIYRYVNPCSRPEATFDKNFTHPQIKFLLTSPFKCVILKM